MKRKAQSKPCQRLIPKRIRNWPKCTIFLEPEYEECEEEGGFHYFWSQRWFLEVSPDCTFESGVHHWFPEVEQTVSFLLGQVDEFERVLCVGRNMAQIVVLLQVSKRFHESGFMCTWHFAGNDRMYVRLERGEQSITWCDIRNWLPGDLHEIGNWCGAPVENVQRFWPDEDIPKHYHIHALMAISAGFYKFKAWVDSSKLGGFGFSLSSIAFGYFSRLPESKRLMKPRSQWLGDIEKRAHNGGFCKAHKVGQFGGGQYFLLDCNGLYGSVLRDELLPYRHITSNWRPEPGDIERAEKRGDYIVQGVFELHNGFLPRRRGRFVEWVHEPTECTLPGPEFRWVREHGKIHSIKSIHLYDVDRIGRIVSDRFLAFKASAKARGDDYEARLWKLSHNSLYGKFSQRFGKVHTFPADEKEPEGEEYCIDHQTGSVWKITVFCGTKIIQTEDGFGDTFFPSISAFITSFARVRLWNLCSTAEWENVFYNDTDSLLVNFRGYDRLRDWLNPDAPGMVKVQEVGWGCEILGEKRYRVGETCKDGTVSNVYRVAPDGLLIWAEKQSLMDKQKEEAGAVAVRMRFKQAWENEVKCLVEEYIRSNG